MKESEIASSSHVSLTKIAKGFILRFCTKCSSTSKFFGRDLIFKCRINRLVWAKLRPLKSPSAVYWQDSRREWYSGSGESTSLPRDEKVGVNLPVTFTGVRVVWEGYRRTETTTKT